MLEYLEIYDFQKHKKRIIKFGPLVTTIVGGNYKGKSTILRCLEWIATNQSGHFTRWGAKKARGVLGVDGHVIERSKGSKNQYKLDGKVFKATGTQVPEEIANLLNISEASWQGQHDAVYCFSRSPGQVSKSLNAIINLGVIDDSLAFIQSKVRSSKSRVEVCEERLHKAQQKKKDLDWVEDFLAELRILRKKEKRLKQARLECSQTRSSYESAAGAYQRVKDASASTQSRLNGLTKLRAKATHLERIRLRIDKLEDSLCRLRKLDRELRSTEKGLHSARRELEKARTKLKICPVCRQEVKGS